jgi:hypothetical protein
MTDRHAQEGPNIPDVETMTAWAKEERRNPTPRSEDDDLKAELLRQHHEDHFGVPDPSDDLTDDELFERLPKPWMNS